ncbi:UNVERIFIED_CONTAM: hypothetical protein Sangu_0475700 [Sesamum angustifolium]|uniref:Uncharacterized protein n=1 Tax=Sesamum angustifolium TaxID=2727405 RepID=A0AAW2QWD8_9LAMI
MASSSTSIPKSTVLNARPLHSRLQHFPNFPSISLSPALTLFRPSPLTLTVKRSANASSLPLIRAHNSPDYIPDAKFYKVEAILSRGFLFSLMLMLLDVVIFSHGAAELMRI